TLSNLAATFIDEGGNTTFTSTITDPGSKDTFVITIDWGDGSNPQSINLLAGATSFSAPHLYKDNNGANPFTINATITDKDGGVDTKTVSVAVANKAPQITASFVPVLPEEGAPLSLSGALSDAGVLDSLTILIDWGDGTPVTQLNLPAGTTSYSAPHKYQDDGAYQVTVTAKDKDGAATTLQLPLDIANVPPTVSIQGIPAP